MRNYFVLITWFLFLTVSALAVNLSGALPTGGAGSPEGASRKVKATALPLKSQISNSSLYKLWAGFFRLFSYATTATTTTIPSTTTTTTIFAPAAITVKLGGKTIANDWIIGTAPLDTTSPLFTLDLNSPTRPIAELILTLGADTLLTLLTETGSLSNRPIYLTQALAEGKYTLNIRYRYKGDLYYHAVSFAGLKVKDVPTIENLQVQLQTQSTAAYPQIKLQFQASENGTATLYLYSTTSPTLPIVFETAVPMTVGANDLTQVLKREGFGSLTRGVYKYKLIYKSQSLSGTLYYSP